MNNPPPILLFPTHYLGNFILGLPWVCTVLQAHPKALLVIDSRFAAITRAVVPADTELLLYPRQQLASTQPFFSRLRHYWGFLRRLRQDKRATLIDLEGERFTGVLSRLSGCRRRIGPAGKRAEQFYTDVLTLDYYQHRYNAFGKVLADFIDTSAVPPSHLHFKIDPDLNNKIVSELAAAGQKRIIAIHAGASVAYKLWPTDYFVNLVAGLEQAGWQVVWVGAGESDRRIIAEAMAALPESTAISFCDRLDFLELAVLLSHCDCFVGSDSGPMHLAASTGIPVLALFGPSIEAIWAPLGDNSRVLRGTQGCGEQCDAWHCDFAYRCLTSLGAEHVLTTIADITSAKLSEDLNKEASSDNE